MNALHAASYLCDGTVHTAQELRTLAEELQAQADQEEGSWADYLHVKANWLRYLAHEAELEENTR